MTDPTRGPPIAKTVPTNLETHGHVRTDNYYWLREREDPEVLAAIDEIQSWIRAQDPVLGSVAPTDLLHETWARVTGEPSSATATVPSAAKVFSGTPGMRSPSPMLIPGTDSVNSAST